MTFLELCQRVRQESGISGSGPESVLNQRSILQKVVEWVRQADLDIQRLHGDWFFLWRMGNANLTAGITQYTSASLNLPGTLQDLLMLDINGYPLRYYSWKEFKAARRQLNEQQGLPTEYTIRPDNVIVINPAPSSDIVATAEYSIAVEPLTNDNDESVIPTRFHDIIVHKALMYYASHEEDASLYQVHESRYEQVLSELSADQLPKISMNGSLY